MDIESQIFGYIELSEIENFRYDRIPNRVVDIKSIIINKLWVLRVINMSRLLTEFLKIGGFK